jgi:hypothetical protein
VNLWTIQRIRLEVIAVMVIWLVVYEVTHWHPEPVWLLISMAAVPLADISIVLMRKRSGAKPSADSSSR